jgi:hypothetical protein
MNDDIGQGTKSTSQHRVHYVETPRMQKALYDLLLAHAVSDVCLVSTLPFLMISILYLYNRLDQKDQENHYLYNILQHYLVMLLNINVLYNSIKR